MEAGTGELTKSTLSLLQADHSIASLICLVAHQYDWYIQSVILEATKLEYTMLHGTWQRLTLLAEPSLRRRLL